jgi:F-type H+-transporting ATPase subunit a
VLWKLPEIKVPADQLFTIGGYPVFNTVLISVLSALIVIGLFYLGVRRTRIVPKFWQNLCEWVTKLLLDLCEEVAGKVNGRRFFPWVASIFLLVLISNWWEVIPGVETIGTPTAAAHGPGDHAVNVLNLFTVHLLTGAQSNAITAWLRPPSTDLNFTIALAIISFVMTQVYGFRVLGVRLQVSRYFTLREGPMGLVVGLLELALEPLRIVSLSFRLFGNLFAGDILLLVMSFLIPFVGAFPFYVLEVFIGFIQAFVFAFLTLIFMSLGTTAHGHEDHEEEHAAEVAREEREQAALALAHREGAA